MSSSKEYYVGVDIGTGSARACLIDTAGEIKAQASEPIKMWQPRSGYYEQSTTDIWTRLCSCVRRAVSESGIDAADVRGIGFDATCSLAVLSHDTDEPVSVTGPDFSNAAGEDRNVILWLDHRPVAETELINATAHPLLRYVGGTMNIEMEIPKVLWLKNHMPPELFARCKFYDLADALTHMATDAETRSFCSTVCKQGYVPIGADGQVKGWQEDFYRAIGLDDLAEENYLRIGGVDKVNGDFLCAGETIATLSDKASKDLGLPRHVKVGSGVIDAYAGWIGTVGTKVTLNNQDAKGAVGAAEEAADVKQVFTRLAAVAGTSTCHLAMSAGPVFVPGVWGPYRDVVLPGFWMTEGGQSATGELLRHVIETHPAHAEALALAEASGGANVHAFLNDHLVEMASRAGAPFPGFLARNLHIHGDLWGNRSPIADPDMRGAVFGLDSDVGVDGLALAYYTALEFIALQTRQIVTVMNEAGHQIHSIFVSGSQCMNGVLMRLIATACSVPVVTPEYVHAAVVHGAALLGAKAAAADGTSLWDIMRRMSRPGKVVQPISDPAQQGLLDVKYEILMDMCIRQKEYRTKVAERMKKFVKEKM